MLLKNDKATLIFCFISNFALQGIYDKQFGLTRLKYRTQ